MSSQAKSICRKKVDNVPGRSGQCPWKKWTMSLEEACLTRDEQPDTSTSTSTADAIDEGEGSGQEINILFNDVLSTFYLWLSDMGKDHGGNEKKPADRIAHTTAFIIPVMEHWLEQ